jgi:Ca2+ transporting ATPase
MDSFASLALATEKPTLSLLDRPPYRRDDYILSRKMVKNLLAMSVYEIVVIYSIVFAGEYFFPEPEVKYRYGRDSPFVYPGRVSNWDGTPLWSKYAKDEGTSRQMTNVFNVFTVMQIFNLLNCRVINDEMNAFAGFFKNYMITVVLIGISAGQVIIVEFGSKAMKVSKYGLAGEHWAIAIGCGFSTFIASVCFKFIPDTWCPQLGKKEKDPMVDQEHNVLSLRKNRTNSYQLRQGSSIKNKEGSGLKQPSIR